MNRQKKYATDEEVEQKIIELLMSEDRLETVAAIKPW